MSMFSESVVLAAERKRISFIITTAKRQNVMFSAKSVCMVIYLSGTSYFWRYVYEKNTYVQWKIQLKLSILLKSYWCPIAECCVKIVQYTSLYNGKLAVVECSALLWVVSPLTELKIGPLVLGSFGKYMKSGGFHEIQRISWNLVDFMHEIWRISWNLVDFRPWNPADFMKSGGFHMQIASFAYEIRWILSMKSGGFHGWSWKMQTFL